MYGITSGRLFATAVADNPEKTPVEANSDIGLHVFFA